jgi:hypothetical protein
LNVGGGTKELARTDEPRLALNGDVAKFCAERPRACARAAEAATDLGRVIRTIEGATFIVGSLLWPSVLSDQAAPKPTHYLYFQRNGGGAAENLRLKPRETKLKPPGISLLLTHTPQEAAAQMRAVFGPGTRMFEASHVIGTVSLDDIRAAGFDVLPVPTGDFPNHLRLIHPDGVAGFSDANLQELSKFFVDTAVP